MLRPDAPVRIARPTPDLDRARRFWCDGLGLEVLWASSDQHEGQHQDPAEPRMTALGWPGAAWHLELVEDAAAHALVRPGAEDLLVVYLGAPPETADVEALLATGGRRVVSPNPYWERWGVTVEDPDGYRLVLCARGWN